MLGLMSARNRTERTLPMIRPFVARQGLSVSLRSCHRPPGAPKRNPPDQDLYDRTGRFPV